MRMAVKDVVVSSGCTLRFADEKRWAKLYLRCDLH